MGSLDGHGRRAALVLAGLILATGTDRAAAQVTGETQRIYPGYVAPYPSVASPVIVFPPGLPDPRPFELTPAPSAWDDTPRRCVAGSYVLPDKRAWSAWRSVFVSDGR